MAMPMWWGRGWGGPWGGLGWAFPLVGIFFMVLMVFVVIRMVGGQIGGHTGPGSAEFEELRREVRELKEEVRKHLERS